MRGSPPVAVADRVARVLPALVQQPAIGAPLVLDESVAVAVAVAVDPLERAQRVRPQPVDAGPVAGPVERRPQQHRATAASSRPCRSTACAAVSPLRAISPVAQLVEDLAGLHVPLGSSVRRLVGGEHARASRSRAAGRTAAPGAHVMSESRPNSVANQGTPAAMYCSPGPGPSLRSSRRSRDRSLDREVEQLVVACGSSAFRGSQARYGAGALVRGDRGGSREQRCAGLPRPARLASASRRPRPARSRRSSRREPASSRASPGRELPAPRSRTQPAFAEPATSRSRPATASAHGSLNTTCVQRRTSSRPS